MTMCTRFVYRGDNIITGFNFDIDIVEWNHKVINTKDAYYLYINKNRAFIVDKTNLKDEDITILNKKFKEKVPVYKEK